MLPDRPGEAARALFPGLKGRVVLNAAAGTPLCVPVAEGMRVYEERWRRGGADGRGEELQRTVDEARTRFARLIGADADEIGFVHCTKAGEQIVLEQLEGLRAGGAVVTNDLHFSGSLHNLLGRQRAGHDVRIVRARDWCVDLDEMSAQIDEQTALVAVSLVSNVNGHVERMRELADLAHAQGAYVYADIIQAAGAVPVDVRAMGIDFAACSGYKWLLGPHGAGFFYVRRELQGRALVDRMYPGHTRAGYAPWRGETAMDEAGPAYSFDPPDDAARYQAGHVSYLGYCGLAGALRMLERVGVANALAHATALNARLLELVDPERYVCISPHRDASPILTLRARVAPDRLRASLQAAGIEVTLAGDRLRVSPCLYNVTDDVERLAEVLATAPPLPS